ncbi:Protein transport protein Sec61 subunit alpha isoform 1 [Astathelohania contejeani]|uniref:Protein transport protein Sec61 subunit alpha isoform 1 n=1 Tax=Astathelohania contejeani TaxID=164912 RepID=A0ABQ7I031_9MICR|nr:Protein transport protein Sec61 subunit alpha isoform 1 [Thelohania contejeani]
MSSDIADPLYWMRMMMASNRGTLMDLGISPVVTSSMILQGLVSMDILKVNNSVKEDRILYQAAQKLLALIMTIGQALVQVFTGFYGDPKSLGIGICALLVMQLIFSGIIVILLDELLQKGYGLGSGVNLFIATNVCESILWNALSPKVYNTARGMEFEGSLISLIHLLIVRKNKFSALYEAFSRKNLPNCSSLISTLIIFAIVIYLQGLRVELPIESTQVKGQVGRWPIKLMYASTMPIIVQSMMISHLSLVSKFLYNKFPKFLLVRILGIWDVNSSGHSIPISGICYYLYPPSNVKDIFVKPVAFTVYIVFMLLTSAFFSRAWIDISEMSAKDVAEQMKGQKMKIKGVREHNTAEILDQYIPTAAFVGGFFIGLVCILSNLFDAIGSGTNIILAVSIVWQYFELFTKESMKKGGMAFID